MYVKHLKIKNFRCFADAEVALNYPGRKKRRGEKLPERYDNVTLFIGPNGSGKTSVFKALCLSILAPIIASSGLTIDYFVRRPVGAYNSKFEPIILPPSEVEAELELSEIDVAPDPMPSGKIIRRAIIQLRGIVEILGTSDSDESLWNRLYQSDSSAFFLAAYGSNRRAAKPEGYTERGRYLRYHRVASIFEEYVALVPFTVGFNELDRRHRLDEAKNILNALLPDGVDLTTSTDIDQNPLFHAYGVSHPFSALSDGYQGFVAWVWDLLVQIAITIPPQKYQQEPEMGLADICGVVIVDEIDLFLHPRWQRLLIEELAKQFPKIQFLFSTHSPLVVGMLEAANIRVLERQGDEIVIEQYDEEVSGKMPNDLLRSAYFGLSSTRAPHMGTISEQARREIVEEGKPESTKARRIAPLSEEQKQTLNKLMEYKPE